MEDDKKRYKATDIKVDGPFDGWIIEELTEDEIEKEDARQQELAQQARPTSGGSAPAKLSPEALEKKREEQLNKIKELINQKRKAKQEQATKTQAQSAPAPAPQVQSAPAPASQSAPAQQVQARPQQVQNAPEENMEEMLQRKSKETGIPVEVLRMIEEKKKEIRARKAAEGNGEKKTKPAGGGVEIYDTVKARREKEEADKYYEEHQVRQVTKKKAPNGEEIGDRETLYSEEKSHDLYNVMDDVGLDTDD